MRITSALLADAATVAEGKLYVHGAAWDVIYTQSVPATHGSMAVALVIEFDWSETHVQRNLHVELLDEDEVSLGVGAAGVINVGHPPGMVHGSPILQPIALTFPGLTFPRVGRYLFRVTVDQQELARIPFAIRTPPQVQVGPFGAASQIPPTV